MWSYGLGVCRRAAEPYDLQSSTHLPEGSRLCLSPSFQHVFASFLTQTSLTGEDAVMSQYAYIIYFVRSNQAHFFQG
jgi:hypothetical protein